MSEIGWRTLIETRLHFANDSHLWNSGQVAGKKEWHEASQRLLEHPFGFGVVPLAHKSDYRIKTEYFFKDNPANIIAFDIQPWRKS